MSLSTHGFSVPFQFPVSFTRGVWRQGNPVFVQTIRSLEPDRRHRVLVVVDDRVALTHPSLLDEIEEYFATFATALELVAPPVLVPGGETVKNDLSHCFTILQQINEAGLDRQSFVAVIGGGAVLDMVSFAAAIAHRGIRTVRLPSTVLSQADSGIAVKNGLNLFGKKNFIGAFVPPFAVINDLEFLESLEPRDKIAGMAEVIKVSLLRDTALFDYLESHAVEIARGDSDVRAAVVQRSADLHVAHICGNGDPFELGSARPLDFGHWAAHKLEIMSRHRLRHGEAVAIGMALDLTYAALVGYLGRHTLDRVLRLLDALGLPSWDEALFERDPEGRFSVLQGLQEFREHLGGELHVTLVRKVGESFEVTEMDETVICRAIESLALRAADPAADAALAVAHALQ
ncbi:MAG: 3-dehydroquinate synthase [Acidobacteria bacterium RIFCSPLOWO2_02_FULL_65_29]|nr:MAG: 3-dehydroquinate synthase [Acidobacteria bacterium RIFCSPLOWO2_02_FULL_65_29]